MTINDDSDWDYYELELRGTGNKMTHRHTEKPNSQTISNYFQKCLKNG